MSEQTVTPENLGIVFVDEPPPAPRKNERNDDLWKGVKILLVAQPGKWAKVKTWNNPNSAGVYASGINNNKNKTFPSNEWEARYESEKTSNSKGEVNGTSSLFLCYKGKKSGR